MTKSFFPILVLLCFCTGFSFAQSAAIPQPASLKTSPAAKPVKTTGLDATAYAAFLKMNTAIVMIDTTIKVSPKMAYMSIDMHGITGSSLGEMMDGNIFFWVTDSKGAPIKIADKFLKRIKATMESNEINYTAKIPFRIKTDTKNVYSVRFRWESKDRKKVIDFLVTK
ncbi:MAG: hypothetical protein EOP53_03425 [Sphingobacteriales bacterium]|nr:MAG: hypothetical protein EOP53_03425 [Sphingobacteriales bacterium]